MLYLALGILGATVMPHNLYLHSGLVQTRDYGDSTSEKREAIKLATINSSIALCLALVINASILILAAATYHRTGHTDVAELDQAHAFLAPLLGSTLAPTLFAIALLCCGLNSTITATLSGQIVMEGFLNLRIAPWLRRMVTRMIAIVPAVVVTIWAGGKATGQLLIFSQVVLSLQLPFAVVPLVMFTASRSKMGAFVAPRWLTVLAALTAAVIIALNAKLVWDYCDFVAWIEPTGPRSAPETGSAERPHRADSFPGFRCAQPGLQVCPLTPAAPTRRRLRHRRAASRRGPAAAAAGSGPCSPSSSSLRSSSRDRRRAGPAVARG